jgi:hypothetical protein
LTANRFLTIGTQCARVFEHDKRQADQDIPLLQEKRCSGAYLLWKRVPAQDGVHQVIEKFHE